MKKVTVPDSLEVAFPVSLSFYFEEREKLTRYKFLYTHTYTHTYIYTYAHNINIYKNCAIRDNREIADGRETSFFFYLERMHSLPGRNE